MISAYWLALIIPISFLAGFTVSALMVSSRIADQRAGEERRQNQHKDEMASLLRDVKKHFPEDKQHCENQTESFVLDLCDELAKKYEVSL